MKSWRSAIAVLIASAFAILVPTVLVVGWDFLSEPPSGDPYAWLRLRNFTILVVYFTSAHVVLLGVPSFLVIRTSRRVITWIKSAVAGFLIGAIPIGLFTLPLLRSAREPSGHLKDGRMVYETTADLWLHWIGATGFMGAFGALGGLSFWLAWRGFARLPSSSTFPDSPDETP
ncbi:hypothetical protein [Rhodanobacter sp. DHB23]|uniref:hypothetical protein n=1 Tax=Rhodanobacter sp. DHB23 TaxID=2775923 RepID=UPI00177D2962|nr:hypothetical protein [Rhodanobacter sp. DHB23]MBD8871598.1 hypothetical protein [Rhodanobacter sp. DHB23]